MDPPTSKEEDQVQRESISDLEELEDEGWSPSPL